MKKLNHTTVFLFTFALLLGFSTSSLAQGNVPASPRASVTQTLGADTKITFDFSRPGVKDRTVWGELVPYGLTPGNKYSKNKPFPWRAGANKNTTMEVSADILVEGKNLPAGKYSIHMIPSESDWVVIFNKNSELWGSYAYKQEEDALRVTVTPTKAAHEEWLNYGLTDHTEDPAIPYLHWEKMILLYKIKLGSK